MPCSRKILTTLKTCSDNSLVGVKIKNLEFTFVFNFSTIGNTYEIVFPDPVCAVPKISAPLSARGITFSCIGVGPSNFNPFKIFNDSSESPNWSKFCI